MEKKEIRDDLYAMIFLLGFSLIAYFYLIPTGIKANVTFGGATGVSSRSFPYLVVMIMGGVSLLQLIRDVVKLGKLPEDGSGQKDSNIFNNPEVRKPFLRMAGVLILFTVFGGLFITVGFAAACIIVLPLILFVLGSRRISHYASVLVFSGVVYILFRLVLNIRIPL